MPTKKLTAKEKRETPRVLLAGIRFRMTEWPMWVVPEWLEDEPPSNGDVKEETNESTNDQTKR